jgi:hypothetical protein
MHFFHATHLNYSLRYRHYLKQEGETADKLFDSDAFVKSKPEGFHPFVKLLMQSQLFHMFILERSKMYRTTAGKFDIRLRSTEARKEWMAHTRLRCSSSDLF